VKGSIALLIRDERGFLGQEIGQRPGYLREIFDETPIKPGVAKELRIPFTRGRCTHRVVFGSMTGEDDGFRL
jgi:hypothetical protein